ncbi:MAG: DUF4157 domain-containing protein, partial [Acidimicrobiia bacterium]|nr:DUF4157 domain-containing protein [Acidimicrobiia bacterium]
MLWRRREGERIAADGVLAASEHLPFADRIQRSFGHHDLGDATARIGGPAATAAESLGAAAYTYGSDVGFRAAPDLHLAAHEAAHVVQQRAGAGGAHDRHEYQAERHADRVADLVVAGRSAQAELDGAAASGGAGRSRPVVQRQAAPQKTHVVQKGETVRQIAEKHGVTVEALIEANDDKLQTWSVEGGSVKGFNAGDVLVIPEVAAEAPAESGLVESVIEGASRMVRDIGQGIRDVASGVVDTVGGIIGAGKEWLFGDDSKAVAPGTGDRSDKDKGLSDEKVLDWIEIGRKCSEDKRAAGKEKEPYNVEQIDRWLVELDADMDKSTDPVQKRVLAGVKFQLVSTRHGTKYEQAERDFDFDKTFDCSEAVQYMLMEAGLGDVFGESTEELATLYFGGIIEGIYESSFRPNPRTGDIMVWGGWAGVKWAGHIAMVLDVRPDDRTFLVSHMGGSGSWLNAFDLDDHKKQDARRNTEPSTKWGDGQPVLGFWSPEDAVLPAPLGTATVVKTGYNP